MRDIGFRNLEKYAVQDAIFSYIIENKLETYHAIAIAAVVAAVTVTALVRQHIRTLTRLVQYKKFSNALRILRALRDQSMARQCGMQLLMVYKKLKCCLS